jgi:hypothetical protein
MMLEPERAAALIAERVRRGGQDRGAKGVQGAKSMPGAAGAQAWLQGAASMPSVEWLVQRTLEELGIHCESTDALQDLKGFLIASQRGAEIVISDRLGPEERLAVYAHLLAHALLEEALKFEGTEKAARNFFSRLEYVEGREPGGRSSAERKAEMVAEALAQAILRGHLEGAPQYAYKKTRAPARNEGLRPALGRLFIDMCHRASYMLFWHSPKYQKLRGRPEVTTLVRRLEDLMRVTYAC